MSAISVLLAEDEAIVRMVIAEELRELGWEITEVGTADEAISAIKQGARFDLVITDVNMPGSTTGLDLAKTVRVFDPTSKIAIMTGKPTKGASTLCDLYLNKPFSPIAFPFTKLMGA